MRDAVHEVACAVDRIDDPEVFAGEECAGGAIAAVQLLAQNRMIWKCLANHRDDRPFGLEIGLGDEVVARGLAGRRLLGEDRRPGAEKPRGDRPAGAPPLLRLRVRVPSLQRTSKFLDG